MDQISRSEFLTDRFDYRPGESIGLYGNTGSGKTFLAYQLADEALKQHPGMRFVSYQPKALDSTTDRYAEQLGLRISPTYPFRKKLWQSEPRGWVHKPLHVTSDTDADIEHVSKSFKQSLNSEFWRGGGLNFVDDEFLLFGKYKCANELEQYLIAGRSHKAGLMFALQSPKGTARSGVSSFHFSQPTHLFWNRESVESNREKYGEVACGLDPNLIMSVVANLRTYPMQDGNVSESLYIDRRGPYAAIISPF